MGYVLLILVWLFNWVLHAVMAPGGNLGGDAPGAAAATDSGSLGWSASPPAINNGDLMPSIDGVINIGSKGQVPTNRFPTRRINSIVAAILKACDSTGASVDLSKTSVTGGWSALVVNVPGQAQCQLVPIGGSSNLFISYLGVPPNTDGNNGDFAFRNDTPGTVNQRLYVKSAGAWVGIL